MNRTTDLRTSYELKPSTLVRRFFRKIAAAAAGKPILDVACGAGRNAIALSELGCTVLCVDRDLTGLEISLARLRRTELREATERLVLHKLDLLKDRWPFAPGVAGGIINVHFLSPPLFPFFERTLSPGGYLLLETVPGCGSNYLELPKAGALKSALDGGFELEFYRERRVGPLSCDAVTVGLLARKCVSKNTPEVEELTGNRPHVRARPDIAS
jgi:SAM-dependent methyltransferase